MAENKKENKKIKELLTQLLSSDEKTILKAVKAIKMHGNESVVEPLLDVYVQTNDKQIQKEIADIFNSIKLTNVPAVLCQQLNKSKYAKAKTMMLSSIWNSNLDYTPYLSEIIQATIDGEFMDAMECLTILENMEGSLNEEKLMDPILKLRSFLVEQHVADTPKNNLLTEILGLLQEINDHL